ncbi:MAG: hypothetical protein ABFS86_12285 [Planctomycetota bacterium]
MPSRILVTLLVLAVVAPAFAGPPDWECHGPWGGLALRISVDGSAPDRALAMTAHGYFLTTDAGESWRRVAIEGAARPGPVALAGGRLVSSDGPVVSSSADGVEWKAEGSVNGHVIGFGGDGEGVLRAVVVSAGPKGHLLFRVMVQEDFGWATAARFTEKVDPRAWPVALIRSHPEHPKVLRVFVTNLDATDATIHYGSDNAGRTWQRWVSTPRFWDVVPLSGDGVRFAGLGLHPLRPPKGLFVTADGGRNWTAVSKEPEDMLLRSLAAAPGGRLLLGTVDRHLLDTTPALGDVKVLSNGLVNESVAAVAIHPADPKRVWVGTQCGLFRSDDGGKSFASTSKGLSAGQFTGLVCAGGRMLAFEFHQGVRISADGARTWAPLDLAWRKRFGKVFGVVARGDVIAASTGDGANDWRITISRDGGKTWSMRRSPEGIRATGIGPKGEVFVAKKGGTLLRVAQGVEFEGFAAGFTKLGGEVHRVRALAGGKRLLLLGAVAAATCSAADGKDLVLIDSPVGEPLSWPEAVLDAGNALYVTGRSRRMFRRVLPDGEWETVLAKGARGLVDVVSDPGAKDRRIAAFRTGLVLLSGDGGRTWKKMKRFRSCDAIAVESSRRLHVVADGAVRSLDLSKFE